MSGHLCLKWNNHSSAFLKSICNIQIKERYCDATIVCQGKYFPVHRVVLSTCSDYFDEMFERMQCQHPYIVFKDIEPGEMEMLLNYMYQGEVNVVQEMLPTLIKAAEALKIRGLAVPDDMPSNKDLSSGKKRSNTSNDNPQPKRRLEESKRRRNSDSNSHKRNEADVPYSETISQGSHSETSSRFQTNTEQVEDYEPRPIKEEPLDICDYNNGSLQSQPSEAEPINKEETISVNFPVTEDGSDYNIKTEQNLSSDEPYEEQELSTWQGFGNLNAMPGLPPTDSNIKDDMYATTRVSEPPEMSSTTTPSTLTPPPSAATIRTAAPSAFFPQRVKSQMGGAAAGGLGWHCCPHCSYGTHVKVNLVRHIQHKHIGDRPFPCPLCPLRCAAKTDLQRHLLIHTGEKPFQCHRCGRKFSRNWSLKTHHKSHPACLKP